MVSRCDTAHDVGPVRSCETLIAGCLNYLELKPALVCGPRHEHCVVQQARAAVELAEIRGQQRRAVSGATFSRKRDFDLSEKGGNRPAQVRPAFRQSPALGLSAFARMRPMFSKLKRTPVERRRYTMQGVSFITRL